MDNNHNGKGRLMYGNEAVAHGAFKARCLFASAYPGTPSTEILEFFSEFDGVHAEWSVNEKVALEAAAGSSFAGARTLVAMKHVGLNVAADPWMTLPYVGVGGGFVLACADDPGMHSSQNEQDSRFYAKFANVPMLEPSSSQECYEMTQEAFLISEEYDTPVMLRLETRICHSRSVVDQGINKPVGNTVYKYDKDAVKRVMIPAHARLRHPEILKRIGLLQSFAEDFFYNEIEMRSARVGIITSGVCYQYTREAFPEASILKLGMSYPLPERTIKEFAAHFSRLYVVEELEPYLEDSIKAFGIDCIGKARIPRTGELDPDIIHDALEELIELDSGVRGIGWQEKRNMSMAELPARPPVLCPGCPHRGIFYVLGKSDKVVAGDIGCYTLGVLPPLSGIDCQVCMGAGISMAHGFEKALSIMQGNIEVKDPHDVVGVIGDSTFMHSGITPLVNMVYNKSIATIIVLDNSATAMTGFQHHPGTGKTIKGDDTYALDIKALSEAAGVPFVETFDPWRIEEFTELLDRACSFEGTAVLIAKRKCVLLEKADGKPRTVTDDCNGCKKCLKIACAAVSVADKKAQIDELICMGCGICAQVCPKDAIKLRV